MNNYRIKAKIKVLSALLLASVLSACSTTADTDKVVVGDICEQESWQQLGYELAISGKKIRTFNQYAEQCANNLPSTAKESYLVGYRMGIKEYCSYESGFKLGEQGKEGKDIIAKCPLELRERFETGYQTAFDALQKQKEEIKRIADREQRRQQQTADLIGAGRSKDG